MTLARGIAAGSALALLCLAQPRPTQAQVTPATAVKAAPEQSAAATITSIDFRRQLAILSHDSLAGRRTGTPGNEAAARILAGEMKRLKLRPAGDSGSYVQRFRMRESLRPDTTGTTLRFDGGFDRSLAYGRDFLALPSGRESLDAELMFVGEAPADSITVGPELSGRIAVFYLPGHLGPEWSKRAQHAATAATAAAAVGLVFIADPEFAPGEWATLRGLAERETSRAQPLPVIILKYEIARAAAAASGGSLDDVRFRPATDTPIPTGLSATFRQPLVVKETAAPNVVGVLPGSDPKLRDEYVVVSAHFDHVGIGARNASGDSIYNGADDNASGTVALLQVARAFRALRRAPARSIVFLAVSGEEQGLRGSASWVAHPLAPIDRIAADVNLDMVTRNAPDTIAVLGQELSSLGATVQALATGHPELRLAVPPGNPWPQLDLIRMSDQLPFLQAGVPAVFFFSGPHPDLHQPSDDLEHCDVDKGARAARLAFLLAHRIAGAPDRPALTDQGRALAAGKH